MLVMGVELPEEGNLFQSVIAFTSSDGESGLAALYNGERGGRKNKVGSIPGRTTR